MKQGQYIAKIMFGFLLAVAPLAAHAVEERTSLPTAPYEPELYTLGYDVFLANGNPADAFLLAERAVSANPRDLFWRRRAAQSSEWSGHGDRALEHWFFLATVAGQGDALENAFRLARGFGDSRRLKILLERGGISSDPALLREYVQVCENMGLPEDAINRLQGFRQGVNADYVLKQLARLYADTGRNEEAVAIHLERISRFGVNSGDILKAATLTYDMGDIAGAFRILERGKGLPLKESDYWQTFGDLSWTVQDMSMSELAARQVVLSGNGREVDYQRLIMLIREKEPEQVYRLSQDAWKRYAKPFFIQELLTSGITLKRYSGLLGLHDEFIRNGSLKPDEQDASYWSLLAQVYRGVGNARGSLVSYQQALRRSPGDGVLAAGYIWLLLDLDQADELRRTLQLWGGYEKGMPELDAPFASAYAFLNDYDRALLFYQKQYRTMYNDPAWLASYADALEQSGAIEGAFVERLRAIRLVKFRMGSVKAEEDRRTLEYDYARLALRISPGKGLDQRMRGVLKAKQDEVSRELVAAWALSSERNDLARLWFWREYARIAKRPRWIELSLAMEENDRSRIGRLLENDLERLPYRDAIEASIRLDRREVAEQLAFDAAEKNPNDYQLYDQLRELYGSRPSFISHELTLANRSGVGFAEQTLTVSLPVRQRLTLFSDVDYNKFSRFSTDSIGTLPSRDMSARLGFTYKQDKCELSAYGGFRSALEEFPFGGISAACSIKQAWRLGVGLQYSERASESVPLTIGGAKDQLSLSAERTLTPRDTISAQLNLFRLLDQNRNRLGSGEGLTVEYGHQLTFAYPDYRVRIIGSYFNFRRDGQPDGKILTLLPENSGLDSPFFVPDSYWQLGGGFSFGNATRNAYVKEWRPFGSLDLAWNSRTDVWWGYEMGIHGPVFGMDKFAISVAQDSGSFGVAELNTIFRLSYKYYLP